MSALITVVAAPACGPANLDRSSMFEVEQQKVARRIRQAASTFVVSASNVLRSHLKAT
jgi:hypothetical protein